MARAPGAIGRWRACSQRPALVARRLGCSNGRRVSEIQRLPAAPCKVGAARLENLLCIGVNCSNFASHARQSVTSPGGAPMSKTHRDASSLYKKGSARLFGVEEPLLLCRRASCTWALCAARLRAEMPSPMRQPFAQLCSLGDRLPIALGPMSRLRRRLAVASLTLQKPQDPRQRHC